MRFDMAGQRSRRDVGLRPFVTVVGEDLLERHANEISNSAIPNGSDVC